MRYFVCDGDETWFVSTEAEARREARRAIDHWRCRAQEDGEWDDEVRDVCWGVVRQEAKGMELDDGIDFRLEDVRE